MAIFKGGKRKESQEAQTAAEPVVGGNNKSKNSMSEFFDISVPASALDEFDKNKNYFGGDKRDGTAFYIGMMLHTDTIGGFSKKTKNDPDKGSIVEGVRGANIDAYVTQEQNDAGELIFIPTEKTFSFAEDFSILTDAEYEVVKIDTQTGDISKTGTILPYKAFKKPLTDPEALSVLLAGNAVAPVQAAVSAPVAAASASVAIPSVAILPVAVPSVAVPSVSLPQINIPSLSASAPPAAPVANTPPAAPVANNTGNATAGASEEEDLEETDETEEDNGDPDDTVYTEEDVVKAVSRVYYSEGLNLEVSSDPFEQLFVAGNRQILFDEKQKDGFVDGELNRMAKNANVEIRRLRQKRLQEMREHFLMTESETAAMIQKNHDMHDPTNDCGRKKYELDMARKEKIDNLDALVSEKRSELEREYEKQRKVAVDEGARKAGLEFSTKFGRVHSDKIERLPDRVRETIESDYNRDLREVYYSRQDRAMTSFDYTTTEVLKHISQTMFVELGKEEDALYAKHIKALDEYAMTLHKEDARRTMIEEERLRVQRDVAEARDEMTSKMNVLTENFEAMKRAMEAKHEAAVSLLADKNKALREQFDDYKAVSTKEKETLQENLDDMRRLYADAGTEAKADYRAQIEDAKANVEKWQDMTKSLETQYKHHSRLTAILITAVVLAALAVGFTVGGIWNKSASTEPEVTTYDEIVSTEPAVTASVNEELDTESEPGSETADVTAETDSAEVIPTAEPEPVNTTAPVSTSAVRTSNRQARMTTGVPANAGLNSDSEPLPAPMS